MKEKENSEKAGEEKIFEWRTVLEAIVTYRTGNTQQKQSTLSHVKPFHDPI